MNHPDRETWTFRIEPLPSTVPSVHRVRSALKVLLRRFGLKCTAILDETKAPRVASAASGAFEAGDGPSATAEALK